MKQSLKILTLILFSSLFLNLSAQDDKKFRFGLQFNPNLSWLKPNTSGYTKEGNNLGFSYGLSTEFFLSQNYLFSTGVLISSVGGKLNYQGVNIIDDTTLFHTEVKQSYNIKYVEIPLSLKLRTNEIGYMTYYGKFGLSAGIKYKSTSAKTYVDVTNSPKEEKINTSDEIFFMNLWLVVGAGAEYNITGSTNVSFGITYHNGLMNALDTKVYELDATTNDVILDSSGNPTFKDKNASANVNFFSLDIGIYF